MKKIIFGCVMFAALSLQGCATIWGGKISQCQKTKPAPGAAKRQVRVVPLVLDICTGGLWLVIDFADGAMYRPCDTKK